MTYWEFLHWLVEHDYIEETVAELRGLHWDETAILSWIRDVVEKSA